MLLPRLTVLCFIVVIGLAACSGSFAQNTHFDATKFHHTETGFKNPPGSPERIFQPLKFIGFFIGRLATDYDPSILPPDHVLPAAEVKKQFAAAPRRFLLSARNATCHRG